MNYEERQELKRKISDEVRRRNLAPTHQTYKDRRQSCRQFYVCAAIMYEVGGHKHRCAKRALPDSLYCRLHQVK